MPASQDILDKLTACKSPWHCTKKEVPNNNEIVLCAYYTGENSKDNHIKGYKVIVAQYHNLKIDNGNYKEVWTYFQFNDEFGNPNTYTDSRKFINNSKFIADDDIRVSSELLDMIDRSSNSNSSKNKANEKNLAQAKQDSPDNISTVFCAYNVQRHASTEPDYWMRIPTII